MSYSRQPLTDLLDRFASGPPVAGGGSAAGISAALGTSLVIMAATLATAKATPDAGGDLTAASARLRGTQARLLALADEDTVAYAAVLAARRLPNDTTAHKERRATMVQEAMRTATAVPLEMLRRCDEVLAEAVAIAALVPADAAIDLAIGIELVAASLRGCGLCVEVNARLLASDDVRRPIMEARTSILASGTAHLERAFAARRPRMPSVP